MLLRRLNACRSLLKLGCCDGFHDEGRVVGQAVIVVAKSKVVAEGVAIRNSRHSSNVLRSTAV